MAAEDQDLIAARAVAPGVSGTSGVESTVSEPYRRRLVGLPLQRSMFADIHRAPALIGLHGVLPDDRLAARLDEDGDLYLDTSDVDRLVSALPARVSPGHVEEMRRTLAAVCARVEAATECAQECASAAGDPEIRTSLSALGDALAALLPFGILSKFVPDALLAALEMRGNMGDPPFPPRSPGAELTRALAALCISCRARGFSPDRLATAWPDVPIEVTRSIGSFCRDHTGFGPLAWEAAGYEDPRYVISILESTLADGDPEALLRRLDGAAQRNGSSGVPDPRTEAGAVRQLLADWLIFLDRETWLVRRAFYRGMLPLLRRLVPDYQRTFAGFVPDDLLFVELGELLATPAGAPPVAERRAKYLADGAYAAKYGITSERLRAVMVTA